MKKSIVVLCVSIAFGFSIANAQSVKKQEKNKMSLLNKEFTTASGLKYVITKEGNGQRAIAGDNVIVHYTGKLTNDTIFDSSVNRNQPFKFKLGVGQVIAGWDEGIALLNVGDKAVLTIPANLGYGSRDMGTIPANSTLIFEVELLGIVEKPKPYDVSKLDTVTTETGLKYIKVKTSEGVQAESGKMVSVHYTGYFENGNIFDSSIERGEPITFPLGQKRVIAGWEEGISKLKVGEKARMIIPYQLAYGENGRPPAIPAKATLIFDVELVDVK